MRKQSIISIIISTILLLFYIPAFAALESRSDEVFGADSITYDSDTELEWLDINLTTDLSYYEIEAAFEPGGDFFGFRHATVDEVDQLFINAGIPDLDIGWDGSSANVVPAKELLSMIGNTRTDEGGNPAVMGITGTLDFCDSLHSGQISYFYRNSIETYSVSTSTISNSGTFYGTSTAYPTVGHWLVRDLPNSFETIDYGNYDYFYDFGDTDTAFNTTIIRNYLSISSDSEINIGPYTGIGANSSDPFVWDGSIYRIDFEESLEFAFSGPVIDIVIEFGTTCNYNENTSFGEIALEALDSSNESLGPLNISAVSSESRFHKDPLYISSTYSGEPITKMSIKSNGDGVSIRRMAFNMATTENSGSSGSIGIMTLIIFTMLLLLRSLNMRRFTYHEHRGVG